MSYSLPFYLLFNFSLSLKLSLCSSYFLNKRYNCFIYCFNCFLDIIDIQPIYCFLILIFSYFAIHLLFFLLLFKLQVNGFDLNFSLWAWITLNYTFSSFFSFFVGYIKLSNLISDLLWAISTRKLELWNWDNWTTWHLRVVKLGHLYAKGIQVLVEWKGGNLIYPHSKETS